MTRSLSVRLPLAVQFQLFPRILTPLFRERGIFEGFFLPSEQVSRSPVPRKMTLFSQLILHGIALRRTAAGSAAAPRSALRPAVSRPYLAFRSGSLFLPRGHKHHFLANLHGQTEGIEHLRQRGAQ